MALTFLHRLGVGLEADERAIRRAYARELKLIDQERDLEGFQALREAYDMALLRLRRPELFDSAAADTPAGAPTAMPVDMPVDAPADRAATAPAALVPADPASGHATAPAPAAEDPELLAQAVFAELRARLAALAPAQSPYPALDSELPWSQALRHSLDDPRLDNIYARRYFEGCVAALLAEGWRPGHEALLVAAVDVFGWDADRRRIQAYGQVGSQIDSAIDERAVFDAQGADVRADQYSLLPRLRDDTPPTERELALHIPTLELMIARFPHWLAMVASVDNIVGWRKRNEALPGWRRKLALLGQKRPVAHQYYQPASGASWFNARWAWGLIVVVVVLLRALFPGQDKHTGSTRTEADLVTQAEQQLDRPDYAGAIASANQAIALAGQYAPAYALRAVAHQRLGDLVNAGNDIDRATALAPTSAYVSRVRALIMLEQARYPEALAAAEDAHRQASHDPDHLNLRAEIYRRMEQFALALADVDASLALDANQYQATIVRAGLLARLQRPDEAIALMEAAAQAHPDKPQAYLMLADLHKQRNQADQAMAALDRGIVTAPDSDLYLQRALLRKPADQEGRERDFTSALALSAQPLRVLQQRARWEVDTARYQQAIATLGIAVDRAQGKPEQALVQAARGAVYAQMGKTQQADADFSAAHAALRQAIDFNNVAWMLATQNLALPAALSFADEATRLAPDMAAYHNTHGLVLLRLGKYAEAVEQYDAALKLVPELAESRYGRGIALKRLGRQAASAAELRAALAQQPGIARQYAGYGIKP